MRGATIQNRGDGVFRIVRHDVPMEASDRLVVIGTVLLVCAGLFLCGAMPAPILGVIAASCLAGEVCLGLKALALLLSRPPAQVLEVERWRARRG
jgi:hypothetical protein